MSVAAWSWLASRVGSENLKAWPEWSDTQMEWFDALSEADVPEGVVPTEPLPDGSCPWTPEG